ncbi:hypothetical protein FG386_002418 [Cryptosporidium ryanae]|uniref:uncharacterized protein n=1 Tax=Cryptosporidium ryanae TaxID=515981 RepID=UPI00351A87E6|nr:hypothetical protein FG386_002418 [Cryptosporidium ryanae]
MKSTGNVKNESESSLEDVLYLRLIRLIYSIKDISETVVELIVNVVLFLTVFLKWIFQFKTYIVSLFKFVLNVVTQASGLITFEGKIYILIGVLLLCSSIYILNKINEQVKLIRRRYNNKWSIVINRIIYIFSPYILFILFIYLPLCIFIPKYYFEGFIIKIWILWIPLNKAVICLYYSLFANVNFGGSIKEKNKKYIKKLNQFINICKKLSNTDIVLNFLEYISSRISLNRNTDLSLLNSKSFNSKKITNLKIMQCWGDYFCLWLIYSFLKGYIIGDGVKLILRFVLAHFKILKIILVNLIRKLILKDVNIIKHLYSIKYISTIVRRLDSSMVFPMYLFKFMNVLVVNLNWRCLTISIIVLNVLLQIKYYEIYDCKFSMLVCDTSKCSDDGKCQESGDDTDDFNSSTLIIYEYPSLILIIRSYIIYLIDGLTIHTFGMTLFGHLHRFNENKRVSNEYTRSTSLVIKDSNSSIDNKNSKLLHSKTMPELNINDNYIGMSQLKIIANVIENNILLNWLPDGIKKYYLNISGRLMSKSHKFKYWILFMIVSICQIPQWIILLFPSFIVNTVGCMLFGFIYPLIMILKINCTINENSNMPDKKITHKTQTWMIYLLTFNLINEIFNINANKFRRKIIIWIPFRSHFYYLIILTLQFISSLIPVIIEQST